MEEFKDRIKLLREGKNITPTQLGALFDKTESAARAWELGRSKPDADTLIKLARYFGCSTDYLLGLSEYKNDEEKQQFINKAELLVKDASQTSLDELTLIQDISRIIISCLLEYRDDKALCKSVLKRIKELLGEISILAMQTSIVVKESEKLSSLDRDATKEYLTMILARFSLWEKSGNMHLSAIYELYVNKLNESISTEFLPLSADVTSFDLARFLFGETIPDISDIESCSGGDGDATQE